MPQEQTIIKTEDGECPAHVFTPKGSGPWPAVIYFMDALGIRPSILEAGQRLADGGFVALVPDTFYRAGPYDPLDPKVVFAQPDMAKALAPLYGTTNNHRAAKDAGAFLAYLDTRSDVKGKRVGTTGYCMGGGMALATAGTYPDRIAAAASFHGGNLANDTELSPHLLAGTTKARVYIGVAAKDNSYPPEMAMRLEKALQEADVAYVSEFYPGTLHGWTQTDFPVYNEAGAERHWRVLTDLFRETLG